MLTNTHWVSPAPPDYREGEDVLAFLQWGKVGPDQEGWSTVARSTRPPSRLWRGSSASGSSRTGRSTPSGGALRRFEGDKAEQRLARLESTYYDKDFKINEAEARAVWRTARRELSLPKAKPARVPDR